MRVAASPAWFSRFPCRWRRHPHGFSNFHAGGSVTRMDFPISMQVAVSPASKILPVNRGSNAPLRASRLRLLYDLAIHELSTPPFFIYTLLGKTSPGSKISNRSGRQTTPAVVALVVLDFSSETDPAAWRRRGTPPGLHSGGVLGLDDQPYSDPRLGLSLSVARSQTFFEASPNSIRFDRSHQQNDDQLLEWKNRKG